MEVTKRYFKMVSAVDQLSIDCLEIAPVGKIKGIVQIVHGMCEYKERYTDFMTFLAKNGYLCVIHDHRGHGKSIEIRSDLGYFYEGGAYALVEDIHQLTVQMKEEVEVQVPYTLIGHSMGSLAVRCYAKKYDDEIDRLVILGSPSKRSGMTPVLGAIHGVQKVRGGRNHSKLFDFIVMNSSYESRFKDEGLHAWICKDKEVVERFNADPYCNFTFTIQGYENLIRLTKACYAKEGWELKNADLPIFFAAGSEDPCIIGPKDFGKTVHFMKTVGYKNVKATLYHGMRHEILSERKKMKVYQAIKQFIEQNEND